MQMSDFLHGVKGQQRIHHGGGVLGRMRQKYSEYRAWVMLHPNDLLDS